MKREKERKRCKESHITFSLQVEIVGLMGDNTEATIAIDDLMILEHSCDTGPTDGPAAGSK